LKTDAPPVRGKGPSHTQRLTPEQVIDERVRRLATSLDLDETQQRRLREVLENERRQIRELRSGNSHAGADHIGPMLAILEKTREEIRGILNEEQRQKYPAPLPQNSTAPANADLDYWIRQTQPRPQQGTELGH
jgi:type II secretory pathway pseudopilin PulG